MTTKFGNNVLILPAEFNMKINRNRRTNLIVLVDDQPCSDN